MYQLAVFKNPNSISSKYSNMPNRDFDGGIKCRLLKVPSEQSSNSELKGGQWEETATDCNLSDIGSHFTIALDGEDAGVSRLVSLIRKKKKIEEVIVYNPNGDFTKSIHTYYFSNIFVIRYQNHIKYGNQKVVTMNCRCSSFKQKDINNNEPVLWDWVTSSHRYTGTTR